MKLGDILGLAQGAGSSLLSWAATFKYWLLSIGIVAAAAFGYGYYVGNDHVVKEVIHASVQEIANAKAEGVKAQAAQDAKDWAAAKADYDARHKRDEDRNAALVALVNHYKSLVPHDPKCVVPAAAMGALNDPALVGEINQ